MLAINKKIVCRKCGSELKTKEPYSSFFGTIFAMVVIYFGVVLFFRFGLLVTFVILFLIIQSVFLLIAVFVPLEAKEKLHHW